MGWAYHIITSIVSQLWADLVLVVTIPWNYMYYELFARIS